MVGGFVPLLQKAVVNSYNWGPRARHFLLSPGGPFTIFFWCPWFKWGIVISNIRDLEIPAQNISMPQQTAVALTGIVWSRYATQIIPRTFNLLAVNLFMGVTGMYQIFRK
jgi:mitochondrial pyruvate carrier 2